MHGISKHRDGPWQDSRPGPYPYEYENGAPPPYGRGPLPPGGPPPPYGYGAPPPNYRGPPPPQEYWGYEPSRGAAGQWGPPPQFEGYPHGPERHMPPPARVPQGPPPQRSARSYEEHQEQPPTVHRRLPNSPGSAYHRGPSPPRDYRFPAGHPRGPYPPPEQPAQKPSHLRRPSQPQQDEESEEQDAEEQQVPKDKKTGDPLSILASVSADMGDDDDDYKKESEGEAVALPPKQHITMPAPTSPLQRRPRPGSIITPSHTETPKQRPTLRQITPNSAGASREQQQQQQPPSYWGEHPSEYMESPPGYHPGRRRPAYNEYGQPLPPHESPALVERESFDSHAEASPYHRAHHREQGPPGSYPPKTPPVSNMRGGYYYEEQQGPPQGPPHPMPYGYWGEGPPRPPYPPPRWNHYGPPPPEHQPHPEYPPYEHHPEEGGPPPPLYPLHHGPPPPHHHPSPYTYVQQPRLEEKTILRKKFSWKHYPEVSRLNQDGFQLIGLSNGA